MVLKFNRCKLYFTRTFYTSRQLSRGPHFPQVALKPHVGFYIAEMITLITLKLNNMAFHISSVGNTELKRVVVGVFNERRLIASLKKHFMIN